MTQASFQPYPLVVPANGVSRLEVIGSYFQLKNSASPLDVRMAGSGSMLKGLISGQGVSGQEFQGLEIYNNTGAAVAVTVLIGAGGYFDLNLILSGGINVRAEPPSASFNDGSTLVANTAIPVFLAAANPNGAIVLQATLNDSQAAPFQFAFLSKPTAPANIYDGRVVLAGNIKTAAGAVVVSGELALQQFIPAGSGLYLISNFAVAASTYTQRSCSYKLL